MTSYANRFTGKAADYAQYRERYAPDIVLPLLREWCGLAPQWTVVDIGAGTGMVGDLFRANSNRVIAIEPNNEMRAACATLHEADPDFIVVDGSAEKTGLADASVELIAVGRALHWFDEEAALGEFRRVLKPRGWVVILACGRTEDGREENVAHKALMQTHAHRDVLLEPLLKVYRKLEPIFAGGRFHHAEVSGEMTLDWNGLRGLTLSLSHAPMPGEPAFPAFEAQLRGYFDQFAHDGRITLTTRTWISAGQFAS
jgi:ubiquinone/menaquinone biosynthesis C-methylase UbiE